LGKETSQAFLFEQEMSEVYFDFRKNALVVLYIHDIFVPSTTS